MTSGTQSENPASCDVMFVQECKRDESRLGFRADVIVALRRHMKKVLHEGVRVSFVNVVDAYFGEHQKPKKKELDDARPAFSVRVKELRPRYIIPLGALATNVCTGKDRFSDWVGRRLDIGRFTVIPMYHPDYAKKSKKGEREFMTQVRNVVSQLSGENEEKEKTEYKLLMDEDQVIDALDWLCTMKHAVQAYDFETTHLDPHKGEPVCMSISWGHAKAVVLYFYKEKGGCGLTEGVLAALCRWMESPVPKVAHNAKFEIKWGIVHFGVEPANLVGDTMQMHHLIDEAASAGLDDLSYQHTSMGGYDTPMLEFLQNGNKHHDADPPFMLPYSGGDADCTRRVYMELRAKIDKDKKLSWLEKNVVTPTVRTLARVEVCGMHVDYELADSVKKKLDKKLLDIEARIQNYAEVHRTLAFLNKTRKGKKLEAINLRSSDQVKHLLYKECGLPVLSESKKTKEPSTDSKVLELLKSKHKVVQDIVDLRSAAYEIDLVTMLHEKRRADDTVYSDFVQDYVVTGRLSSRNPNLQNIPTKSLVKGCFTSIWPDGKLLQADANQLELRLIGSETGDDLFLDAFATGKDIHMETACGLYNKLAHQVSKDERTEAKRINFGVVYGITEYGLAKQLNKTEDECRELLRKWWLLHPKIKAWMRRNVDEAREHGFVRNRLGRIRHVDGVDSDKWWIAEKAERTASNSKIQSLGADYTMWAFHNVDTELRRRRMKSRAICQVHDSVIVDMHPKEIEGVPALVEYVMDTRANELFTFLQVPLTIKMESGYRWSEMEEVKDEFLV